MIETIVFDLAEVCIKGLLGMEDELSRQIGTDKEHLRDLLHRRNMIDLFKGQISEDAYWLEVIRQIGSHQPIDFFKAVVRKYFTEIPGTPELIRKLKEKDYAVGLLSDHAREWIAYVESNHDFMRLFDIKCYSFESGHIKLEPQCFEYALSRMKANRETTLFIDDSRKNIAVAGSVGIKHLHLFVNSDLLQKYLAEQGISL